ncbi:MAG TPA: hypothetical protein VF848_11730 [Steroidobacteraceae bacterium]
MFDHVTLLLSFIYVIALTHLLSCTTGLILARGRVCFSPLLALWMLLALGILFNNWLSIWLLHAVERWTTGEIALSFTMAIVQYFTCSLVCIEFKSEGKVDMETWYEQQRRPIIGAFASLFAVAMLANYLHRGISGPHRGSGWIGSDAILLAIFLLLIAAMGFRARWLQWTVALVMLAGEAIFIAS